MSAFLPGVAETIGFYVYLLIDPRDESVFYVGKGTGHRCLAHIAEARKTIDDIVGDYGKLRRIREIEATGAAVRIDILRHGLSEREALLIESSIIDLLGLDSLENRVVGHETAGRGRMTITEINALYGAEPIAIDPAHRVVLIRINRLFERGMSDAQLYEATRRWWRVGAARRHLGAPTAPTWAMAVYGGVVRAVFRIEEWELAPDNVHRWGFSGFRDVEMERHYLSRDVSAYFRNPDKRGASQTPLRYINC
jgi:hypothetical protein